MMQEGGKAHSAGVALGDRISGVNGILLTPLQARQAIAPALLPPCRPYGKPNPRGGPYTTFGIVLVQ